MPWQDRLRRLVEYYRRPHELLKPLDFFVMAPPSGQPWPDSLPVCPSLREFYKVCDGGFPNFVNIAALGELPKFTEKRRCAGRAVRQARNATFAG